MEIVVRSDAGEAELRLAGDHERHTLGEIAEVVLGHRGPTTVLVDDTHQPADRSVVDAGVRRGSVIDLCSKRPSRAVTPAGRMIQVAGHGTGASIDLRDGSYQLGPTARSHARHLDIGTVTTPKVLLHVQGQLVEVEVVAGSSALLAGRPLLDRRAWTSGELVVGDRVFERSDRTGRPGRSDASGLESDAERRHLTPIPVGRSLDNDTDGTDVAVDPAGGIGVVADHDDALAILRAMVLELAMRSWPHGTALGIRTANPEVWEWTKWLIAVDTPRSSTTRTARRRHVVVVDDGTLDERRHRYPRHASVIAGARTQDDLPPGLAAIVHAVGGDHTEPPPAVSVTTVADGTVTVRPAVAPYALDASVALDRARRQARRWPGHAAIDRPDRRSPDRTATADDLRLTAWTVARSPSALERRIERRCDRIAQRHGITADDRAIPSDAVDHAATADASPRDDESTMRERLLRAGSIDARRVVLPVGTWVERSSVATIPLTTGRRLAIIGGRRSDRSALLSSMAESARAIGPDLDLFAVSPRRGLLVDPERVARLGLDVAVGPADVAEWIDRIDLAVRPLVLIDGADRVGGPSFIRLASEAFPDATIVVTLDDDPPDHHWSAPWSANRLTIRMAVPDDDATTTAVLDAQHRPRSFHPLAPETLEPPAPANPVPGTSTSTSPEGDER